MADQKDEVKKLIEQLDVSADKKSELLKKLESEGASDGLMGDIKNCLNEMEEKLLAQVPETEELTQANAKFNAEMDAVEGETVKLDKQLGQQLDQIEIEQNRNALKSQ